MDIRSSVAIVGIPLVGKATLFTSWASLHDATIRVIETTIPSGDMRGVPARTLQLRLPATQLDLSLCTASGGQAVEILLQLLGDADLGVFVFDGRAERVDRDLELWTELRGALPPERWLHAINRRPGEQASAAQVLAAVGADGPSLVEFKANDQQSADVLLNVIKAHLGRLEKRLEK
jgi:predicted GTPase